MDDSARILIAVLTVGLTAVTALVVLGLFRQMAWKRREQGLPLVPDKIELERLPFLVRPSRLPLIIAVLLLISFFAEHSASPLFLGLAVVLLVQGMAGAALQWVTRPRSDGTEQEADEALRR